MSHFTTVVLVDPAAENVEEEVKRLLEPYDENTKVEPYLTECWCVGREAQRHAVDEAQKDSLYDINSIRMTYHALPEKERTDERWEQMVRGRKEFIEKAAASHPMYQKPNPECEDCGGSGQEKSTYNPKSKWDWWVIGGRWDGELLGEVRDDGDGGFNFGAEHRQLKHNSCFVRDINPNYVPFAIVTPDGEWHERGRMGWWGIVSDAKPTPTWEQTVKAIFAELSSYRAVACDLHI